MSTRPSILIAGFGSVGRRHLHNLQELGCQDIALYRTGKSTLPTDELAGLAIEHSLDKALEHRPVAAVIANPTSMHLETALAAARAGCHLLIEKPVAHKWSADLAILQEIADEKGLVILVGFQFRFHPGLQQIKRLVQDGAIGPVVSVQAHWGEYLPEWHPWEDYRTSYSASPELGGGVVLTLCHPFDYLRWLVGEVSQVSAELGRHGGLDIPVEDTVDVTLRFASGAIGHVHLDYVQRPPGHWLQVVGQRGTLRWDSEDGVARCYRASEGRWEDFPIAEDFERNSMFFDEMRHFLACIDGAEQPRCTLADGVQALKIALAAKQSAVEKRAITL
jgi:predicted dehydrogenase